MNDQMNDQMLFRPKDLELFLEPEERLKFTMFIYHACPPASTKRVKVGRGGKGDLVTEVYHYDINQCLEIIEDKIANSKNATPTLKDRWLKFSAALEALKIVRLTDGDLDGLILEVQ